MGVKRQDLATSIDHPFHVEQVMDQNTPPTAPTMLGKVNMPFLVAPLARWYKCP
jgi:hypothetical protein